MEELKIRSINENDINELTKLLVEVYNAPPWNDRWTIKTACDSIKTLLDFPQFYGNVILLDDKKQKTTTH